MCVFLKIKSISINFLNVQSNECTIFLATHSVHSEYVCKINFFLRQVIPPDECKPTSIEIPQDFKVKTHYQKVNEPLIGSNIFVIWSIENEQHMTYESLLKLAESYETQESDESSEEMFWRKLKNPKDPNRHWPTFTTESQYCITMSGTCFDENSKGWNLSKITGNESLIHALPENEWMPGIHRPYIFLGMCGTSFPWHREDRNLMSINYMHDGREKLWYTIPEGDADNFEKKIQSEIERIPKSKRSAMNLNCNLVIRHKIVHAPPSFLKKNNIKFGKVSRV